MIMLMWGCTQEKSFVKRDGLQFIQEGKPYRFMGTNYWYGALLGMPSGKDTGRKRLVRELSFLAEKGVTNLRILAGAEGFGKIRDFNRVEPALQPARGVFNEDVLKGLDFLLDEMSKRNMKAVIFLSNNWEWSGGFLQYVNWHGFLPDSVMRQKMNWDSFGAYASQFYNCEECVSDYVKQVDKVITRVNSVNGKKYREDNTIMTWELANEPRPMRRAADRAFVKWVLEMSAHIKSLDKNHLVTAGCEGQAGTESMELFEEISITPNIDYLTIHLWPKNWGWLQDTAWVKNFDTIAAHCRNYMTPHIALAEKLNKPLVLEEFGFPRDKECYRVGSPVIGRDKFYEFMLGQVRDSRVIAGCNFWGFGGMGRPVENQIYWEHGDDFLTDPPLEEQGLNSVFDTDTTTWKVIKKFITE